jgi:hypothetical protein
VAFNKVDLRTLLKADVNSQNREFVGLLEHLEQGWAIILAPRGTLEKS